VCPQLLFLPHCQGEKHGKVAFARTIGEHLWLGPHATAVYVLPWLNAGVRPNKQVAARTTALAGAISCVIVASLEMIATNGHGAGKG
jgi:hypothetical protein